MRALTLILFLPGLLSGQPAANDTLFALLRTGKIPEAQTILTSRYSGKKQDDIYHYLNGRILFQKGDPEAAITAFEKAVQGKPAVADYHLWLGRAAGNAAQKASMLRQPGLAKQCKNAFEQAAKLDPKSVEARNDLIGFYLQAPGFMGGSTELAAKMASEIEAISPWSGFFARYRVYVGTKNESAAEMLCKDGLQRWPDSASVYAQYGNFLYESKRYDEAWEMYSKADKVKPNEWGTRYQLIKVAAVSGSRTKEVLPWAAAYAAAPPTEDVTWKAYFHFRHGQLLENNGDKRAAADAYRKALALKSDLEAAKKALDRVK